MFEAILSVRSADYNKNFRHKKYIPIGGFLERKQIFHHPFSFTIAVLKIIHYNKYE